MEQLLFSEIGLKTIFEIKKIYWYKRISNKDRKKAKEKILIKKYSYSF